MLFKQKINLNRNTKILLSASLVTHFGIGLFAPIYAIFVEKIGGNILDVGIAYAIFSIVTGVFIILLGTSKFFQNNVRKMVVTGFTLMGITYLTYTTIQTPTQLFLVQIMLGITNGILEPAWDAVFSARSSEKQESKNWSLWAGGVSLMAGTAAIIGSYIANYSFNIIFIIMATAAFTSAIISSQILKK